jgi:helix-turn-helix protein
MVAAELNLDPGLIGRAYRAVEPLHSQVYFAPEHDEHLGAVGLEPGRMAYLAGRSAPMGAVAAGVVAATFFNFSPALIARHIPRAWTIAAPEQILAARLAAARASLTRLLGGPQAAAAPEIAELGGLLREACAGLTPEDRPLYAGHADLPWPVEPLPQLWHGASVLREYRGDGHLTALVHAGLNGIEALVTHTATGRGFTEAAAKELRGWTDEEWSAACAALARRGLLDETGLTDEGQQLRAHIEVQTDALSADPWLLLGSERTARVVELGKDLARRVVANGAFPRDVFARA